MLGVDFPAPAPDGRPLFRAEPGVDASAAPRRMRCFVDIVEVKVQVVVAECEGV